MFKTLSKLGKYLLIQLEEEANEFLVKEKEIIFTSSLKEDEKSPDQKSHDSK